MILHSLTITDFRAFRGTHHVPFATRVKHGAKRPIVLLGGLNGSGKTTLFLAIKLALYGRQAIGIGTSKANYEKFILECIHSPSIDVTHPRQYFHRT